MVSFRQNLLAELARRRTRNPRYSLRAFARDLGTDHATLSQILRGRRNLSPRLIRQFGRRLQLKPDELVEACEQLNTEAILRLARRSTFRPNSRWIATRTGLRLDAVNCALHRLIHQGRLVMETTVRWTTTPYA